MAYLITFNCYGKHLPGDVAGWNDRIRGNHRGGFHTAAPELEADARDRMKAAPFLLTAAHAVIVLGAIKEVCTFRQWELIAAHVRTNHVHVMVNAAVRPDRILADLKSYSSRVLNRVEGQRTRWARGGNTRVLSNDRAIEAAVRYVCDGQGEPMAVYIGEQRQIP